MPLPFANIGDSHDHGNGYYALDTELSNDNATIKISYLCSYLSANTTPSFSTYSFSKHNLHPNYLALPFLADGRIYSNFHFYLPPVKIFFNALMEK